MSRDFIGRKFENCFKKSEKTYQSLQSMKISGSNLRKSFSSERILEHTVYDQSENFAK